MDRLLLVTFLALAVATSASAAEPELIVEIEKQDIYEGESVLYRVTLNHVENPPAPKLDGFDAFQVTSLGEQSLDSRQITIINGQRSEIVRRGRQYNYRLTPMRSGTLTIPAPTAEVNGNTLTGREIALNVSPPDEQDTVILEFSTDRTIVYPMQPFELSLTIAVKDLPGEASDQDPLSVQPKPPALTVAWLDDDQLPEGIDVEKSWREILEPLISRRGNGFQVNNVGTSSVFSLFGSDATGFHPQPVRTTRSDSNGQETGYWEYRFARRLIPRRIGPYQFGPVTLKGTFADGIENGRLVGRTLYARALGLGVTVQDVPLTDRPDSYIGAVGTFEVQAELAPTTARVGDPMTLTLTISGQGTLDDVRPPELVRHAGIENSFRTYEATEESTAGSRRFTYSLRPLSTDVIEFPAIAVSFFDVNSEKYVTRRTTPIPITIHEAETLTDADIVSAPSSSAVTAGELEASEGGVFANDSNLSSLRNEAVHPSRWVVAWGAMLACWAAASLAIRQVRRLREDPALQRRRSAAARARATLADSASTNCESLQRAITGLIADFADVPEAGLTPRDAAARLESLGIDDALRTATQTFLHDCDAARYGAAPDDVQRLQTEAAKLVEQLIVALRTTASKSPVFKPSMTASVILFGLLSSGCSEAPDLETSRQFQDAELRFNQAVSPDDFVRVAHQYSRIGGGNGEDRSDFVSGAVLYNTGNAWMRAGHVGQALAAYRQAQRYRPRDAYLAANLQNALAAAGRGAETEREGLAGYVFFWQNWLSYPEKFITTTVLLALVLLASLTGQLTKHRLPLQRLSIVMAVLCVLSAISVARDWYRFTQTIHAVVTVDQAIARKGNSDNYAAAFTDPLPAGTEGVVLEDRADWLHIQFGDAGTGWLPGRSVVTY